MRLLHTLYKALLTVAVEDYILTSNVANIHKRVDFSFLTNQ